jgi:hypothetical protein
MQNYSWIEASILQWWTIICPISKHVNNFFDDLLQRCHAKNDFTQGSKIDLCHWFVCLYTSLMVFSWLKFEFLFIFVISIFINYVSKLQWTNVTVRRPLKWKFTKHIKKSSTSCRQEQLEFGDLEVKLYSSIGALHELLCT